MGRTGRTVGQDRGFPARDGRAGQEAYIYRPLSRPSIRYLHHEKELRRFRPVRAVATGTMPGPAGVDPGLRPRASPLVSTPSRRLELQQTQYVPHRDPLAEQLEVYARLGGTSPPANREEEPVLEALELVAEATPPKRSTTAQNFSRANYARPARGRRTTSRPRRRWARAGRPGGAGRQTPVLRHHAHCGAESENVISSVSPGECFDSNVANRVCGVH